MSALHAVHGPDTDELQAVLAPLIESSTGTRMRGLRRRPSPYQTSFAVDELDVLLEDGRVIELLFKNVGPAALAASARNAKPRFLYHPLREIRMYRRVLNRAELGTALLYGASICRSAPRYWLFIERVDGVELYQVGEFDLWLKTAAWLARMHDRFSSQDSARALPPHTLIDYNQQFYRRWLRRARAVLTDPATDWLLRRYESAIARLLELPRGLIHGEFYPANVLVQGTGPDARICPVDWEMAACAPPLMDLAAFVAGRWSDTERARLVAAYRDHTTTSFADPDFAACRLHVAVQWLAWSRRWVPPAAQRHDWLGEARQVAEELAA